MSDALIDMTYRHHVTKEPPPDAYSMHMHNTYELLYFLAGDATHVIEDRKYKLKKGDLIITMGCGDIYKVVPMIKEGLK